MKLSHLTLSSFRSYEQLDLDFSNGVNLFLGPNGSGKTNLAEAIYYLSLAKSWRSAPDRSLIAYGHDYASIYADVIESGMSRHIEIHISPNGRKILINGKPIKRLSELSRLVNVVLFTPEDVALFKGSPGERRNFLDVNLSKRSLDYFSLIGRHNRLLDERNAALKQSEADHAYLEVITERLIEVGEPLEAYRRVFVDELNKVLSEVASELYGHEKKIRVCFHPFVRSGPYKEEALKAYRRSEQYDIVHKLTSVGLQREDFSLELEGKDIAIYGSQGENRLASIALKLSPYFLIDEEEKKPIAVLDDVYSELDEEHSKNLTALISSLSQVFVTGNDIRIDGASTYDVSVHKASRRN